MKSRRRGRCNGYGKAYTAAFPTRTYEARGGLMRLWARDYRCPVGHELRVVWTTPADVDTGPSRG